jgi:hypothetical protein
VLPVDWRATLQALTAQASIAVAAPAAPPAVVSHVLDFGPGGPSGTARMTARVTQGAGVTVVCASVAAFATGAPTSEAASSTTQLDPDGLAVHDMRVATTTSAAVFAAGAAPHWPAAHGPRLAVRVCDGALLLDTRFARLLGRPPVMVAGMTPCTSLYGIPLVAACENAGFHAELACGGLPRPAIFKERLAKLQGQLAPGHGICLNLLYLNAKQWGFQYPMIPELVRSGVVKPKTVLADFVAAFGAGFFMTCTVAPFDKIRTRLMNQPPDAKIYSGFVDCLIKIVRAEGPAGLYAGFIPIWARFAPTTSMQLVIFGLIKNYFDIEGEGG